MSFFGKFGPKKQNCQFKLEIWYLDQFEHAEFNGNVHFSCFRTGIPCSGKFGPKKQNCPFILKFGTKISSNMKNSMAWFILSILDWKYPFSANLLQKITIVSLN